ncbi:hypothetical protein LEMLEM_LOCUS14039 [Lemmus lemmus]
MLETAIFLMSICFPFHKVPRPTAWQPPQVPDTDFPLFLLATHTFSSVSSGFKHKHEAWAGFQDENKPRRKLQA